MLAKWHASLPPTLRLPDALMDLFPTNLFSQVSHFGQADGFGQDRACWSLHMSYNQVSLHVGLFPGTVANHRGQLVILSVRPAMLMAVWKAIASIVCVDRPFDIETHPQIEQIRSCSDAARRNLRLGRLMRLHSPRQKLLLPDLHHIFNAAIVLTMHQIVFVNLRTRDLDDIGWATEVFEGEAETGSDYAKDCARVLRDLQYLVNRLRNPIHDPSTKQSLLTGEGGALRELLPDEAAAGRKHSNAGAVPGALQSPGRQPGDTIYQRAAAVSQTLFSWWKADDMQFYYSFLS